jgi:hypothetical protein
VGVKATVHGDSFSDDNVTTVQATSFGAYCFDIANLLRPFIESRAKINIMHG